MREPDIRLKRAWEQPRAHDGVRVLVDRLWPRGRSKDALQIDEWSRALAPSDELRKWYAHDPERWPEFQRRYRAELRGQTKALDHLLERARGRLTLVYGARDTERNQAVVLRKRLLERCRKRAARKSREEK